MNRLSTFSVVLSGTFVIEPIRSSLAFWSQKFPQPFHFTFAPYHQIFQQLLDPNSLISTNKSGINVLLIRPSDINQQTNNQKKLIENIQWNCQHNGSRFILCFCPDHNNHSSLNFEQDILSSCKGFNGISFIESSHFTTLTYPHECFDPQLDQLAHIPYTSKFYSALGTRISRKLYQLTHPPYKVIVLDCDQTLWKGICGEDSLSNIHISSSFKSLQLFMRQQRQEGMLLCLASKNHEEDVVHIFKHHPEMQLKWEEITAYRINWEPKSINIHSLAKELNLGLESFLFIDDNPLECAEVVSNCPEVLTLQLPKNEEEIPSFLQHLWVCDPREISLEDKKRALSYEQEKSRALHLKQSPSLKEFLNTLELEISITEISDEEISRSSQLTWRTNQFNFTTIRRSETELFSLLKNPLWNCKIAKVKDRFGDYGTVGLILFQKDNEALYVETFLLSCRVLGKGVEHFIIRYLGNEALKLGVNHLKIAYCPSKKNQPAFQFLKTLPKAICQEEEEDSVTYFRLAAQEALHFLFDPEQSVFLEPLSSGFSPPKINKKLSHSKKQSLMEAATQLTSFDKIHQAIADEQATDSSPKTIDILFHEQALKSLDAIAIISEKGSWSYGRLKQKTNQVARYLEAQKIQKGDLIAVSLPKEKEVFACFLGILQSGAAFIPLDPDYPNHYRQGILKDSKAKLLICDPVSATQYSDFQGTICLVDPLEIFREDFSVDSIPFTSCVSSEDLAYVIYTSGSTGQPKGVMVEHHSVCNLARALTESFQIDSQSRVLQFSSISFDAAIAEWIVTLLAGGTLVLLPPEDRFHPQKVDLFLKNHQISTAILPPSFIASLENKVDLSCLKTLIVAGEANREEIVKQWSKKVHLINAYGPTEGTVCSTVFHYSDKSTPATTIGKPIIHTEVYVLDPSMNPVQPGEPGELYLGGEGVARGYLHRPDLTSLHFASNPFSTHVSARLYKTGDLVRYLPDGNLDFLGRVDHQIKWNGFRIEPQQIEATLLQLENIKHATVVLQGKKTTPTLYQLTAYIERKKLIYSNDFEEERSVKKQLTQLLPSHMIPTRYIFLTQMPMLPNGKIDRAILSQKLHEKKNLQKAYHPRNLIEFELTKIWEDLLRVKEVGIFDHFFYLGGTSLLSVQLMARVQEHFNCSIPFTEFLSLPTIDNLAKLVEEPLKKLNSSHHPLFTIQENKQRPSLFLVHPSTGLAFAYTSLKYTSLKASLYGINNPFLGRDHFPSLQSMASHYVQSILQQQGKGPYYLGGWSFGGIVAYEIAQQLRSLNLEVKKLVLIDSYPLLERLDKSQHSELLENIESVLSAQSIIATSPEGILLTSEMKNNAQLLENYIPISYDGRVILLKSAEAQDKNLEKWSLFLSSNLEVFPLTKKHTELFDRSSVHEIGSYLSSFLEQPDHS